MRYALYFTPQPDDPLTIAAQSWLGRDAFTGKASAPHVPDGFGAEAFREAVADPRRYGFHATLVAPFRLRDGLTGETVADAADALVGEIDAFAVTGLRIARIGSFFALTSLASAAIDALASAAVDRFDGLRAAPSEAEIERRRPERLSERQRAHLHRYGYPYVKDEYRFHMTLTGALDSAAADRIEPALHDRFGPLLDRPLHVSAVAIFVEPEPGAEFIVHSVHRLGAVKAGKLVRHAR